MTKKELKIIKDTEREFWKNANYYEKEANNKDMDANYRKKAKELHYHFVSKWATVYSLMEDLKLVG